ncbi:unnamed protein product [Albugo candida]|uniref:Uncharacterized protein n=1 Tax=Albugo candida TaxID=65357 RepID=A0A024FSZ7_9STRA|nr:unnamed protein product [Albugo candida]CCI11492.1 unnamed protein product [Albugo candida]|eukprot:CCI10195.1 unnamed protein product [Albugo candida]
MAPYLLVPFLLYIYWRWLVCLIEKKEPDYPTDAYYRSCYYWGTLGRAKYSFCMKFEIYIEEQCSICYVSTNAKGFVGRIGLRKMNSNESKT